jgi:hypothetical protein
MFRGLGVPGCLLGYSGSAAPCIRKRGHQLLDDWGRICLEIRNITFGFRPHHPKQLWYSNVLIELFQTEVRFLQWSKTFVDTFSSYCNLFQKFWQAQAAARPNSFDKLTNPNF